MDGGRVPAVGGLKAPGLLLGPIFARCSEQGRHAFLGEESVHHPPAPLRITNATLRFRVLLDARLRARGYWTGSHVLSGLNEVIVLAIAAVSAPRSFCSTIPSWLTRKDITPEFAYSAG